MPLGLSGKGKSVARALAPLLFELLPNYKNVMIYILGFLNLRETKPDFVKTKQK